MSDTHVHLNINPELFDGHGDHEFDNDLRGYDETFLPYIVAKALNGKSCSELRQIYRHTRSQISEWHEDDDTPAKRNEVLAWHVKDWAKSVHEMGCYRHLRKFSDAVIMTAVAITEVYREKVVRTVSQTSETRDWGGLDATFCYDHAPANDWLINRLAELVAQTK